MSALSSVPGPADHAAQPSAAPPAAPPATPPATPQSAAARIVKATLVIAVAHLCAKAFGLVQTRVISETYGFSYINDAFVTAFENCLFMLFLIGEESLGPAFLPLFLEARDKSSESKAWAFASTLLSAQFLLIGGVVAVLMLFPGQVAGLLLRENALQNKQTAELAVHFLQAMAPALFGLSIGSLTYMLLNGYKQFFWPAFADAALKIALVAAVLAGNWLGLGPDALVVGVLLAGAAKLGVHLFALGGRLKLYRPKLDLSDPYIRRFLLLVAPLLAGILFAKFRDIFNNSYVLSGLGEGTLSMNSAGRKIYTTIGMVIPYSLSLAMFPFICEMVDRNDREQLGSFLDRSSRMLLLLFVPLALLTVVLGEPLGRLIFNVGQVNAAQAALVGQINACYCLALPFTALENIFMQAYFSTRRMLSVTLIGMFCSTLTMVISYTGIVVYKLQGADALMCVALGFAGARALKALLLIAFLKVGGPPMLPLLPTLNFAVRLLLLSALSSGAAWGTLRVVERVLPAPSASVAAAKTDAAAPVAPAAAAPEQAPVSAAPTKEKPAPVSTKKVALQMLPRLALPGLAALVVFVLGCRLLRLSEFDTLLEYAREKLRRRKARSASPAAPPAPDTNAQA